MNPNPTTRKTLRPIVLSLSVLLLLPLLRAPEADAETATPMDLSCLPADEAGQCPSEEDVAADALAAQGDGAECYSTAYSQEEPGEEGAECCYLLDTYCDAASGCGN